MDSGLAVVVREDLEQLRTWVSDVSDSQVRVTSTILRRLLLESTLQRAWKAAGFEGQPVILAPDFRAMLNTIDGTVLYALAGGASSARSGAEIQARFPVLVEGPTIRFVSPEDQVRRIIETDFPFLLTDFVEGPVIFARGDLITRRQLIKYVCNKLGGAHYDPKREECAFRRLDEVHQLMVLDSRHGVFFEVFAIGQQLAAAPDIGRLLNSLRLP